MFAELAGQPGRARILEAFLAHAGTELTATDLCEIADVSKSTVSRNIDRLVESALVEVTRRVGNTTLYELNRENPAAADLAWARLHLLDREVENTAENSGNRVTELSVEERGSTGEDADPAERVGEIVPQLFTEEDPSRREELARELREVARETPSPVLDLEDTLLSLRGDGNETVEHRVAVALEIFRRQSLTEANKRQQTVHSVDTEITSWILSVHPTQREQFETIRTEQTTIAGNCPDEHRVAALRCGTTRHSRTR